MKKEKNKRIIYFDFLRIFAIAAIILIHVAAENWYTTEVRSLTWNAYNIFDSVARWGVPIFVMISGTLFLDKEKSIKEIFKKNIVKLINIFFFWSLIYTIWDTCIGNITNPADFFIHFFKGPIHLWFILMIIGLYLISPLLRLITSNKRATKYFLILSFIFAFLIPEIISLIDIVCPPAAEPIKYLNSFINVSFVLGYSGYYVLGYYLHKTNINKKIECILYILGILGLIATALLSALASIYKNMPVASFYEFISVNVLFTSIAIFIFGKHHLNKKLDDKKTKKLVFSSKCTLGIYLIHPLLLSLLDAVFNFNTLSFNPVLSVPIIWLLIFATSTLLSIILNKIPFINKWIV